MDFAKKQLEKYGWQEGKGLGKSENGISIALKPKLKFDNAGLGHDNSEQFTNNWWEKLYNKASNNLNVSTATNGNVALNVSSPDAVEITTKSYSLNNLKKKSNGLEYGNFIKTSKLTDSGVVDFDNNNCQLQLYAAPNVVLTDEELFAACGGRTAHKGARHGLTLNGKLSRLEKQEKLLLKKLKKVSLTDETDTKHSKKSLEKKLKKIGDHKDKHKTESMEEDNVIPSGSQCSMGFSSPHKNTKKRKKERKRVSFSETVTEYQTQDLDSSTAENQIVDLDSLSDCSSRPSTPVITVRQVKIKAPNDNAVNNANLFVPDQDEGIDCSDFDITKEKDASDLQAKIREENKRMKRKLKRLRRKDEQAEMKPSASLKETHKIDEYDNDYSSSFSEKCPKCIKRKMKREQEDCENIEIKKCHYECEITSKNQSNDGTSGTDKIARLTKRERKQQRKKERRLEKRISKVADSLNQICKISDAESE